MVFSKVWRIPVTGTAIFLFLFRNILKTISIPKINYTSYNDVGFYPCTIGMVGPVIRLSAVFHNGIPLAFAKRLLLRILGERLCLVVKDKKTNEIVGYSLYYFNHRDIKESTVHEGDTGLLQEYRGRGIGTAQRLHALQHFARCPFIQGVSSRVSLNNLASLKSNLNLGFEEQERYYDPIMGEERVYLVCDLAPYRESLGSEIIDENPQTLEREKFIK